MKSDKPITKRGLTIKIKKKYSYMNISKDVLNLVDIYSLYNIDKAVSFDMLNYCFSEVCFKQNRKPLGMLKELGTLFDIDRYKQFAEYRKTNKCESVSSTFFRLKYGVDVGDKKRKERLKSINQSKESMIERFGEEIGKEKFEKFCERNKGNFSLERQLEICDTEKEAKEKFDRLQYILKNKNTLKYYIENFGEEKGKEKYFAKNAKNSKTTKKQFEDGTLSADRCSLEYHIKKFGKEIGKEKYAEKCKRQSDTSKKMWKSKEYVENHKISMIGSKPKRRKSMEENGIWVPLDKKTDYELYCYKVCRTTDEQELDSLIDRNKWGVRRYNNDAYELDHIISKKYGFDNNILPYIIGDITNLQFIHWKDNISKGTKCYSFIKKV